MFTCFWKNTPTLSCLLSQNVCSHPALSTSSFMVRRFRTCLLFLHCTTLLVFSKNQTNLYANTLCLLFFYLSPFALLSFFSSYPKLTPPPLYIVFFAAFVCDSFMTQSTHPPTSFTSHHLYLSSIPPIHLFLTYDDGL